MRRSGSLHASRNQTRRSICIGTTLLLGALLLALSTIAPVAYAQKPAPPLVLPPVRYSLTWLDFEFGGQTFHPEDINNSGMVVGLASDPTTGGNITAVAYSSTLGTFYLNDLPLNDLLPRASWWDLDATGETQAFGWSAFIANGINDFGDIVGYAKSTTNPNLPDRAFLLENALSDTPRFLLLPTVALGTHHRATGVNNLGEVVGYAVNLSVIRYSPVATWPYYVAIEEMAVSASDAEINDAGVIVAQEKSNSGFYQQLILGGPSKFFSGTHFYSLSNGSLGVPAYVSGYRGRKAGVVRQPVGFSSVPQTIYANGQPGALVNDNGDLCFAYQIRGLLYYENATTGTNYGTLSNGILPLDKLVTNQDSDWLSTGSSGIALRGINTRGTLGFGQICGYQFGSNRGFLLTPIPIPIVP